jgi:hypothetical protein
LEELNIASQDLMENISPIERDELLDFTAISRKGEWRGVHQCFLPWMNLQDCFPIENSMTNYDDD